MIRAKNWIAVGLLCVVVSMTTGCLGGGYVYTRTVRPLTKNFDRTPVAFEREKGNVKHFRYQVDVIWDENGIGEIAKQAGFKEIYYADLEVFSVLGVWSQYHVNVYGAR